MVQFELFSKAFLRPLLRISRSNKSLRMTKSVCVVGGGFGGLYTALNIEARADPETEIYLIDPKENFVFLPLLYEFAVGTASAVEVAPTFENLLFGTKVKFIRGSVIGVDFATKTCELKRHDPLGGSGPNSLKFDKLVIAAGVQPNTEFIPGAKEYSLPFYTVNDAYRLKDKLHALKSSGRTDIKVTVIGAGYAGVEVATNVAQNLANRAKVTIIDRNKEVMSPASVYNRDTANR